MKEQDGQNNWTTNTVEFVSDLFAVDPPETTYHVIANMGVGLVLLGIAYSGFGTADHILTLYANSQHTIWALVAPDTIHLVSFAIGAKGGAHILLPALHALSNHQT